MKKPKKTIFSKIFTINLITIVVSVVLIFIMQTVLISQFVYTERIANLKENAKAISAFIENGTGQEHLNNFIYGFSQSTKTNILIIGSNGDVLLASAPDNHYNRNTVRIDKTYMKDVLSRKESIIKGTLGDTFHAEMFTLQVPVVSKINNRVLGAIFISTPVPEMTRSKMQLHKILGVSLFLVILISFTLSFALSRRISKPIKKIGQTARQFAQGNFSNRVNLDKKTNNIIEISELTQTFNDMAYSLEKADDIRNSFISDVAHEFRTPMTTISGFVDGILDETIPPERHHDYLTIVRDEVSRLSGLVNSLLNLTRLETDKQPLEVTAFDICETLRRTLVGFESRIEEKKIEVQLDIDEQVCQVIADMNAIRQILTNLIENAIKFTNVGGLLRIEIKNGRTEVKISVYNTGCGISDGDKKMIFERFYKADKSRSLNREGTGIGLYIVKELLSHHNKTISVNSVEGEFAEFVFHLDKA
jgi:signal transduction histidine kinase